MHARSRGGGGGYEHRWRWVFFGLVTLWSASACRKEAPPAPEEPAPDVGQITNRLSGLACDEAFFRDLDALKEAASKPGADPTIQDAILRFDLATLAAGLSTAAPWLSRVTGGGPDDAGRVAMFLRGLSDRAAQRDPALAHDLRALAGAFDASAASDLTGVLRRIEGDGALAPAIRLVVARRLLDALRRVVGTPEFERGRLFMQVLPGWPNPPTSDPMETAFPTALKRLSQWLALGEGPEKGLAPHYAKTREDAAGLLQAHLYPMPVVHDPKPRAASPAGVVGVYSPLVVATLKGETLSVGLRPVLAWQDGEVVNLAGARVFPGDAVASAEELSRVTDQLAEALGAKLREAADAAAPLEAKAYAHAGAARNADRTERGRALLWAVDGTQPARRFETALALAERAGFTDVRLMQPGFFFEVIPAFFRKVARVPEVAASKGEKVLVALGKGSAEVYPTLSGAGCGLPPGEWPEGVRVLKQGAVTTGLQVRWDEESGFRGLLSQVLGRWFQSSGRRCLTSPAVPVIVRSQDLPTAMVLDAATEIALAPGTPFASLGDWFPGATCGESLPCPAAIPILFAADRVPKPSKPEVEVEVSRPAGFCDQKEVARVMNGRAGAVRACYEMHLQRNPELAGRLEVRFTIEEDGTMSGLTVTVNELNQEVAACVIRQISSLKFPKPAGGVCVIRWPYRFQPGG